MNNDYANKQLASVMLEIVISLRLFKVFIANIAQGVTFPPKAVVINFQEIPYHVL